MTTSTSQTLRGARQRLLTAAATLFYRDGIAATGIDAIVKHAGVAKMSLYNHFDSKAALVACYLEARHQEWLDLYARRLEQATTPLERILAVFFAYEDHAELAHECGFRGCGLLNAAAELPAGALGRRAVRRHKEQVEALLAEHLAALTPDDLPGVQRRAQRLAFLLEGAVMRAGLEENPHCLVEARRMAPELL
ncbi:TetR/AcrR family transcriptional regulator [Kushneria aurantia]|uniref:TetR/AcrR family transcriptional regulator n=1 Tax=Kushneria aurantia TaxID=504092 RepID=A0ABV6G385_9GAMM|nr:TetR/AcrR family transcriptional regulator [Kushneria aurantia]